MQKKCNLHFCPPLAPIYLLWFVPGFAGAWALQCRAFVSGSAFFELKKQQRAARFRAFLSGKKNCVAFRHGHFWYIGFSRRQGRRRHWRRPTMVILGQICQIMCFCNISEHKNWFWGHIRSHQTQIRNRSRELGCCPAGPSSGPKWDLP